jgi:hypothetical protein
MYAPDEFGQPRLRSGMITRSTLWRRNSNAWGAFALSIVGVGYFPECRLLQYLKGGFFATGESHLDANERVYRQFVFRRPVLDAVGQRVSPGNRRSAA